MSTTKRMWIGGEWVAAKDGKEESGSNSYVPPEAEKDTQLQYALKLMRGEIPEPPPRPADPEASNETPAPPAKK